MNKKPHIDKAIKQGLKVIIKNPIILALIIINSVLACIYYYFFPEPEYFRLYDILFRLVSFFLMFIIIKMVYDSVIKGNISISNSIGLVVKRSIFLVIGFILYFLITTGPLFIPFAGIVWVIPGMFFLVKLHFFSYAILLDNKKIIDSFKKSWQIVTGNWWEIFVLVILLPFIVVIPFIILKLLNIPIPIYLISFIGGILLMGWLPSSATIVYIQLTKHTSERSEQSIAGETKFSPNKKIKK